MGAIFLVMKIDKKIDQNRRLFRICSTCRGGSGLKETSRYNDLEF